MSFLYRFCSLTLLLAVCWFPFLADAQDGDIEFGDSSTFSSSLSGATTVPRIQLSTDGFTNVLFAQSAEPDSNASGSDISNAIGNSVAAYDFRLNANLEKFQFKAYRLFYLEGWVSTWFCSLWDGMWGAGIEFDEENRWENEIFWEHMNTKRQDSFDYEPHGRAILANTRHFYLLII